VSFHRHRHGHRHGHRRRHRHRHRPRHHLCRCRRVPRLRRRRRGSALHGLHNQQRGAVRGYRGDHPGPPGHSCLSPPSAVPLGRVCPGSGGGARKCSTHWTRIRASFSTAASVLFLIFFAHCSASGASTVCGDHALFMSCLGSVCGRTRERIGGDCDARLEQVDNAV